MVLLAYKYTTSEHEFLLIRYDLAHRIRNYDAFFAHMHAYGAAAPAQTGSADTESGCHTVWHGTLSTVHAFPSLSLGCAMPDRTGWYAYYECSQLARWR